MSGTDLQLGGGYTYQWECAILLALNYFFEPVPYESSLFTLVTGFLGKVDEVGLEARDPEHDTDLEDIVLFGGGRRLLTQVKTKQATWGRWTLTDRLLLKALGRFYDSLLLSQQSDGSRFVFLTNRPFNRDLDTVRKAIRAGTLEGCPEARRLFSYLERSRQPPLDPERFFHMLARTTMVKYLDVDAVKANILARLQPFGRYDREQAHALLFERFSRESTRIGGGTVTRESVIDILGPYTGAGGETILEGKSFEPELVFVRAGRFQMGTPPGEGIPAEETGQHSVHLGPYRIGKYPVTNGQYAEFLTRNYAEEHRPRQAGWFIDEPPADRVDHPVVGVNWHSARAYCDWLRQETGRGYRLPTEAEWEKAARGSEGWVYPWGNDWQEGRCTPISEAGNTTPVVTRAGDEEAVRPFYPEGASPFGCYDTIGNVQEWTSTLWGSGGSVNQYPYPYRADEREDPDAEHYSSQAFRVYRGGRLRTAGDSQTDAERLRCATRGWSDQQTRVRWRGFRVACDV
jgi:formylglycine-generating enzyme required for sulfatase activity